MGSMSLADVKCDPEERAGSVEGTVEDRPLKGLIYPPAVITVKKVLKG